ncbi:BA75_02333T0 [Komagataella pastoris]|uniref:BA75_02333T0 n=1 Tax=Komagataella pastoris TaxID=4922 RepID=A0A1B2JDP4_PICPA|nr:BA75_02333T0 [Komagataella pastoris]
MNKTACSNAVKLAFDKYRTFKGMASGNPIIFLHGLLGNKLNNRATGKHLSRTLNKDVYCLDLRNHGASPHNPNHDYQSMAQDVECFIRDNHVKQPIIIGHSMGAKVAMSLALRNAKTCSMLISVDNVPTPNTGNDVTVEILKFEKYLNVLREAFTDPKVSLKSVDSRLQLVEPSKKVRTFLMSNIKKDYGSGEVYCRIPIDILYRNIYKIFDFPYQRDVFNGPSLFIRGTESHFVHDTDEEAIQARFPQYRIENIKAGHWIISENPQKFNETVKRFIWENEKYCSA